MSSSCCVVSLLLLDTAPVNGSDGNYQKMSQLQSVGEGVLLLKQTEPNMSVTTTVSKFFQFSLPFTKQQRQYPFFSPISTLLSFNPLHPNINMHILHTVLHTFLKMLTGRICSILTLSNKQVMRTFKLIRQKLLSRSNTKFS